MALPMTAPPSAMATPMVISRGRESSREIIRLRFFFITKSSLPLFFLSRMTSIAVNLILL